MSDALDRGRLAKHLPRQLQNDFTGRCDVRQMFATASEHLDAQLIFQQANLLANTGLRGKEALSRCRHVEVVMRDFPDVA